MSRRSTIYFAGAIRGGREDQQLYRELIDHLGRHGTVLTEHVGFADGCETPAITDNEIFRRDMTWLEKADVVIAEVSTPSLGVGYEIARAEGRGIPCLCLFRKQAGRKLSAMVSGNEAVTTAVYRDGAEAMRLIDDFLSISGAE